MNDEICNVRNRRHPGWLLRPHQIVGADDILDYYTQLLREVDLEVFGRKTYELMVPYWIEVAKSQSEAGQRRR
jgi:hypothetical protein